MLASDSPIDSLLDSPLDSQTNSQTGFQTGYQTDSSENYLADSKVSAMPTTWIDAAGAAGMTTTRVILVRHGRSTFNQQGRFQGSCDRSDLAEQGRIQAQQVAEILQSVAIDALFSSPLQRAQATLQAMLDYPQWHQKWHSTLPPIHLHESLREIDLPEWEGLPFQQVRTEQAAAYRQWQLHPHEFTMHRSTDGVSDSPLTSSLDSSLEALSNSRSNSSADLHHRSAQTMSSSDRARAAVLTRSQQAASQPVQPSTQAALFYPVLDLYQRARTFWQQVLPDRIGQTLLVVSHGGTNHALISTALGLTPAQHHRLQQSNGGISLLTFPETCWRSAQLHCLNGTAHLGETLPKLKAGKRGLRLILVPLSADRDQWQWFSQRCQSVEIDFSLSSHGRLAESMLNVLLHPHPQAVRLETTRRDFLQAWQQTIQARRSTAEPSRLHTGLVLASESEIQQILAQAIGLNPLEGWRLPIDRSRLSVLHYPGADHPPVLQGLNLT